MALTSRFQKLAADAKTRIKEITAKEASDQLKEGALLIDVRETEDFSKEHVTGAVHMSRGTIELKIEEMVPDTTSPIICYCGGGSRSALAADNLQKMGYANVASLAGGFKSWKEEGLPIS